MSFSLASSLSVYISLPVLHVFISIYTISATQHIRAMHIPTDTEDEFLYVKTYYRLLILDSSTIYFYGHF